MRVVSKIGNLVKLKTNFLQDDEFQHIFTPELLKIFEREPLLERGRALFELARRSSKDDKLLDRMVREITSLNNIKARTFGIISISFLGIAGLVEADSEVTTSAVKKIIEGWPEDDRVDLIHFLKQYLGFEISDRTDIKL